MTIQDQVAIHREVLRQEVWRLAKLVNPDNPLAIIESICERMQGDEKIDLSTAKPLEFAYLIGELGARVKQ